MWNRRISASIPSACYADDPSPKFAGSSDVTQNDIPGPAHSCVVVSSVWREHPQRETCPLLRRRGRAHHEVTNFFDDDFLYRRPERARAAEINHRLTSFIAALAQHSQRGNVG